MNKLLYFLLGGITGLIGTVLFYETHTVTRKVTRTYYYPQYRTPYRREEEDDA